jgi:malate dehydrogenase (oxaloacetate-decarboxylating)(NADP+)
MLREDALEYHRKGRPGKLEIVPTKPMITQRDLSLAYSPGVAYPVLEIEKDPDLAYEYTIKGNLVAVISNGTAILGLGDRGALASKPVMEGKAVLFKKFADVDAIDIEVNTRDPDEFIRVVQAIAPTFGGINLEDIKAPECFYIEETLRATLDIPVFHDDQHGTAVISAAALLNALELVGKRIDEIKVVINGAGASGIACADLWVKLGVRKENLIMLDTKGVIYKGRKEGMNPYKERFAADTEARTLAEAIRGADVFLGLSVADVLTPEMVKSMAERPIIFALANPDPEIRYELAKEVRPDAIVATGRSDYPKPGQQRAGLPLHLPRGPGRAGAGDQRRDEAGRGPGPGRPGPRGRAGQRAEGLRAGDAALRAGLHHPQAAGPAGDALGGAGGRPGGHGDRRGADPHRHRGIPGAAGRPAGQGHPGDALHHQQGEGGPQAHRLRGGRGAQDPAGRRPDPGGGDRPAHPHRAPRGHPPAHRGAGAALPAGDRLPPEFPRLEEYAQRLYEKRQRKGVTLPLARTLMLEPNYFGPMMVEMGDADAFISGLTYDYPAVIRPALQVVGVREGMRKVAGLYIMIVKEKVYFFTDATVNIEPTAEDLAEIAIMAADFARRFDIEPRVAMLSFSNFGSTRHPLSEKVRQAVEIVRQRRPDILIDGEMQADTAVVPEIIEERYPFSRVKDANVLVFPDLEAANVSYKLLQRLGNAQAIGPILLGMGKPVHVLQTGDEVQDIVFIAAIAALDAQERALAPAGVR